MIVQIAGQTMALKDVLNLAPGSIVELPKSAEDELELMINNKTIGVGTAVKVGENFGLRVTRIGDVRTRVDALGPEARAGEPPEDAAPAEQEADRTHAGAA